MYFVIQMETKLYKIQVKFLLPCTQLSRNRNNVCACLQMQGARTIVALRDEVKLTQKSIKI